MRASFLATLIAACVVVCGSAIANADPVTAVPEAPIGHFQPHAPQFSPDSQPVQTEQDQMSTFDAEQQKLDKELDKSLNICRC
jgi:hypothetical protein